MEKDEEKMEKGGEKLESRWGGGEGEQMKEMEKGREGDWKQTQSCVIHMTQLRGYIVIYPPPITGGKHSRHQVYLQDPLSVTEHRRRENERKGRKGSSGWNASNTMPL
ncbi:unnamed protein product [Ilex paraguariensis]|uniref:Uncharacterized protein n=1 Tax=Ilex paraguariensis TaxID=185542 RepID=A0ABC8QKY5_9AQUA